MADEDGATPNELILGSTRDDDIEMLDEALAAKGQYDINVTDAMGNSALHKCIQFLSTECLERLLAHPDINVNLANRIEFNTPLHAAVLSAVKSIQNGGEDLELIHGIIRRLLEAGANLKVINKQRQKPIDLVDTSDEALRKLLQQTEVAQDYKAQYRVLDDDGEEDGEGSD